MANGSMAHKKQEGTSEENEEKNRRLCTISSHQIIRLSRRSLTSSSLINWAKRLKLKLSSKVIRYIQQKQSQIENKYRIERGKKVSGIAKESEMKEAKNGIIQINLIK